MTALACLRIIIDTDDASGGREALATLISKVGSAFLEGRWPWPRRFGLIAPGAFLLADPRSNTLDASELTSLSDELHLKLFGANGRGNITLALLEGDQESATRFAALNTADLKQLMAGNCVIEGMEGKLSRITPEGVEIVAPRPGAPPAMKLILGATPRPSPSPADGVTASFNAIWCPLKDTVIGSGLNARRNGSRAQFSIIDGPADMPGLAAPDFDRACLEAAPRALVGGRGLLFLPVSFSSTINRPTRESYIDLLEALPNALRPRLAAAVYDVPRAPSFAAIRQLKAFLAPYFSFIDLQTADPAFQIDSLMMETVHSVTLTLPETDEGGRLAAATRFMANRDAYQRRRIWTAITNVRTRRELDFCVRLRAPFLSGRAVSGALVAPAEPVRCNAGALPLREAMMSELAAVSV